ncbi:MAG: SUMF1/EgtB/PvdO family nonheme iron enzyme [bacterium]|nr:SUMF1/EgtB/PvdO family nonheme iron enzyme [bacterium]
MAESPKSLRRGLDLGVLAMVLFFFAGCGGNGSGLPSAPAELHATVVSYSQIDLGWTDKSSNEVGFKIEQKTGLDGTFAQIGTVLAGVADYQATGLDCEMIYSYRVRAFNGAGDSDYSEAVSATTGSCSAAAPTAPSGLVAAVVSSSQLELSWTDNSGNEDQFKIERKAGADGTYMLVGTVEAEETVFLDRGLICETAYSYRVGAYNEEGGSSYSEAISAMTGICPLSAPAVPSTLKGVAVSSSEIDLSWKDNSNNEDEFQIERKTGAGGAYALVGTVGANRTTYQDSGLTCGTTYSYQVRAYNGMGDSNYSIETIVTTKPCPLGPPTAPSALTATVISTSKIGLSWADNSDNEQGFKIERKTGTGGNYFLVHTTMANATSWTESGLSQGVNYHYRVFAFNAGGDSGYSNEVSATPGPPPSSMSSLPAGCFSMGSNDYADAMPIHNVCFTSAFQIDTYLVTNAQYKSCVDAMACSAPSRISSARLLFYYGTAAYDDYPVIYVSWTQAKTYCEWLGKRLPTEAEWESAARGGLSGQSYPWGNTAPVCTSAASNGAQYDSCHPQDTIEVGSFSANGYGLYDMAGNVREWVNDWYGATYYSVSVKDDPPGPGSGNRRVIRGGGWNSGYLDLRVSARSYDDPANQGDDTGFRCAR